MSNPKTTNENYNMTQTTLPLEIGEETLVSRNQNENPTFIPYNNQQSICLFDLQDLIPINHIARVVDEMIEGIDDEYFFEPYKGGGRSAYHPKMMVKVLLYAYSQKVYSCREIAKLLNENLPACG